MVVANKAWVLGNHNTARVEHELSISIFPEKIMSCPEIEIQKLVPAIYLIQHPITLTSQRM